MFFSLVTVFLNDKNDEPPIFVDGSFIEIEVAENINAKFPLFIHRFLALDRDANSKSEYNIISGNSTLFSLNSTTGDFFINGPLDYETEKFHEVTLRVSDAAKHRLFSQIVLKVTVTDVNDNAPVFTQPYYMLTIRENVFINHTLVTVKATDADSNENGEIYYTIEEDEISPFIIDYFTGEFRATKIFDYEEKNYYTVRIRATDNGKFVQLFDEVEVRVFIKDENDNPPILRSLKQDVFVEGNVPKGIQKFLKRW